MVLCYKQRQCELCGTFHFCMDQTTMPYSWLSKLRQVHVSVPFAISREPMMWSQPARPVLPKAHSVRDCLSTGDSDWTNRTRVCASRSSIVEALLLVFDHLSFCCPLLEIYIS